MPPVTPSSLPCPPNVPHTILYINHNRSRSRSVPICPPIAMSPSSSSTAVSSSQARPGKTAGAMKAPDFSLADRNLLPPTVAAGLVPRVPPSRPHKRSASSSALASFSSSMAINTSLSHAEGTKRGSTKLMTSTALGTPSAPMRAGADSNTSYDASTRAGSTLRAWSTNVTTAPLITTTTSPTASATPSSVPTTAAATGMKTVATRTNSAITTKSTTSSATTMTSSSSTSCISGSSGAWRSSVGSTPPTSPGLSDSVHAEPSYLLEAEDKEWQEKTKKAKVEGAREFHEGELIRGRVHSVDEHGYASEASGLHSHKKGKLTKKRPGSVVPDATLSALPPLPGQSYSTSAATFLRKSLDASEAGPSRARSILGIKIGLRDKSRESKERARESKEGKEARNTRLRGRSWDARSRERKSMHDDRPEDAGFLPPVRPPSPLWAGSSGTVCPAIFSSTVEGAEYTMSRFQARTLTSPPCPALTRYHPLCQLRHPRLLTPLTHLPH